VTKPMQYKQKQNGGSASAALSEVSCVRFERKNRFLS